MFNKWQLLNRYLGYYANASNRKGHGVHSPFIFKFITEILNDREEYADYKVVESLRHKLLNDHRVLQIDDYGAGSVTGARKERTVSSLAKHAAKPKKYGQLLYRMATYYKPATIVELGTSLGITTAYLSLANPGSSVISLEGSGAVLSVAKENLDKTGMGSVQLVEGNFDDTLGGVLQDFPRIDLAFIDGNHREEPTLRYFEQLLPAMSNDSMIIFDDIHWSAEMERAWAGVRHHPAVRCSVDLFFIGIAFFREEFREKQHFSIRF